MGKLCILLRVALCFMLAAAASGCQRSERAVNSIQIKGSDTEVNLVQRLAEVFMQRHPAVSIAVTGGGSGTGIAALINRQTDIANSSRAMKDSEIEQARRGGVTPVAIAFAFDGLAIITNGNLPVDSLTIEEVGNIYRGDITNWQALNGPDLPVSLYGRQSNSGTFVFFRDNVVKGDYAQSMKMMNGTAQIVEAVKQDRAGIGYVGIGYVVGQDGNVADGVTVLRITADARSPAVTPLDPENVKQGVYPISRPLYQYVDGIPEGNVLDFIRFELGEEGQRIVSQEGYYQVSPKYAEKNRASGVLN